MRRAGTIRYLRKTGSKESKRRRREFAKTLWKTIRPVDKLISHHDRYYNAKNYFKEGVLGQRIPNHVKIVLGRKKKARILDVGSATGSYWNVLPEIIGINVKRLPEAPQIELHTLNPSYHYAEQIPTQKERQHVGTAQTKNLAKLGRFDLITTFYVMGYLPVDLSQTSKRLASRLSIGGKLFVVFGLKELQGNMSDKEIKEFFGKNFKVVFLHSKKEKLPLGCNGVIVERIK